MFMLLFVSKNLCTHTTHTHTHTHAHTHTHSHIHTHVHTESLVNGCAVSKKGKGRNSRSRLVGRTEQRKTNIHSMQYVCLASVCAISTSIYSKLLVPVI
jgi:hypothetical protein